MSDLVTRRLAMTFVTAQGAAFALYVPSSEPLEKVAKMTDELCDHIETGKPFSLDDTVRLLQVGTTPLPDVM